MAEWDACLGVIDRASLAKRRCYVGMDLSSTKDLTALVAVFPDEAGFAVLAQFFVPQEQITARSRRDHVPYDDWAQANQIRTMPGPTVDYEVVRATLQAWAAEFDVQMIAYDPWNSTDLVSRLEQQDGLTCVPMRQGFGSLSAPTKSLEKAILARQLRHNGDPVLRWNVSNVAVEADAAGNLKPSKVASTERIDGVVALVMAVDLMDRNASTRDPVYSLSVIG
jgi:phage terminase large subunit-like protein